jgi:hypothetical protein
MNWTELLKAQVEDTYKAAEGLLAMVADEELAWKPASGENWMTTGQLLKHMTEACGAACRGFVTGDWGMPDGTDISDMSPEEMLPPAEAMPAVASVAQAREGLAADKELALAMIDQASHKMDEPAPAPWDPRPTPLGRQLLGMIGHLEGHKVQLFYYLKLQGRPVNTLHYYGMA